MAAEQAADRMSVGVSERQEERRKSHRNDPEFQNRFRLSLMQLVLLALVPTVALSLVVNHTVVHPEAFLESPWVFLATAAACATAAVLLLRRCDKVSNRYCGPTYRIIQVLDAISRGERVQPLRVRKNDEFEQLVKHLNRAFVKLGVMDEGNV